jgi:hypothetical protein
LSAMGILPWLRAIGAQVGFVTESEAANALIAVRTEAIQQVCTANDQVIGSCTQLGAGQNKTNALLDQQGAGRFQVVLNIWCFIMAVFVALLIRLMV